jgi:hypothetical protein
MAAGVPRHEAVKRASMSKEFAEANAKHTQHRMVQIAKRQ